MFVTPWFPPDLGLSHSWVGLQVPHGTFSFRCSFSFPGNSWRNIWLFWSSRVVNKVKLPYKWHRLTNMWISVTKSVQKRKTHMTKGLQRKSQIRHAKILYLGKFSVILGSGKTGIGGFASVWTGAGQSSIRKRHSVRCWFISTIAVPVSN